MGKKYSEEIEYIPNAIEWALNQNIEQLARCLISLSARSLLGIGSGGSTTAAAFMAMLHENHNSHARFDTKCHRYGLKFEFSFWHDHIIQYLIKHNTLICTAFILHIY